MSLEESEIKIIRLITGEDLIGFVSETNDKAEILFPKIFYYDNDIEIIYILDYLDEDFFQENSLQICKNNILFITLPNEKFGYQYLDSLIEENLDPSTELYKQIKQTLELVNLDSNKVVLH